MYHFPYFKENDEQVLIQFIHDHPFAFMTGSDLSGKQVATQIPILLEERDDELYLQGHFMRRTDHHRAFMENPQVLVVFTGPHAYVSASWYSDPYIGSTWNYMSVHIAGQINFMPEEELIGFMRKLTLKFEQNNENSPTYYDNLPDSFLNRMLPAIVGFEIKVENMENVFKLSQNRDERSYQNIMTKLEAQGGQSALVAREMEKRAEGLGVVRLKV